MNLRLTPLRISVVMPSHNRAATLPRTLHALARQTGGHEAFEVILVADGCRDQTVACARQLQLPYAITILETPGVGAAAARNLGARHASAPLLLMLDDDMEASPNLIAAHLAAHTRHDRMVVLGHFQMPERGFHNDPFLAGTQAWWSEVFSRMIEPGHRFYFKEVFAGNLSLPRSLFDEVGGFDEAFHGKSGEDYELAFRLMRAGARFAYEPSAASIHHDQPTLEKSLVRARAEGRGHVRMLQRHPDLYPHLRICEVIEGLKRSLLWRWIWTHPRRAERVVAAALPWVRAARAGRLRKLYHRLYGSLHRCHYWMGVRDEVGSLDRLRRFVQDLPLDPQNTREIELDLTLGLEELTRQLQRRDVDGARLWWGPCPVGRIAPVAGLEALRGHHLPAIVPARFAHRLIQLPRLPHQVGASMVSLLTQARYLEAS